MIAQWSMLVFVAPIVLTAMKLRSAWLWLSVAASLLVFLTLLMLATSQWASGHVVWFIQRFLTPEGGRAYHDTYYVVTQANLAIGLVLTCLCIGALLFIPQHPKRTTLDVVLFWLSVMLFVGSKAAVSVFMGTQGMPRQTMTNMDGFILAATVSQLMGVAAVLFAIWAAARPVLSWWRARKI